MGHHHHHHHQASKNIGIAFFLNFSFTIIEIIGGFWTGSIAILSDALHDLGDTVALGFAYFMERLSNKESSAQFTYGYKRLSLLSALVSSVILMIGSGFILFEASRRLLNPQMPNAKGMALLAVFGIAVNGYAALKVGSGKSLNEKALSWHLLEDVLGWVAVLVVSIVMMFWHLPILDPILSLLFSLFILYGVVKTFWQVIKVFLQAVPSDLDPKQITTQVLTIPGVQQVHDVHIWSLDGEKHVVTLHVVVEDQVDFSKAVGIKDQVKKIVQDISKHSHVTLEIEHASEDCAHMNCVKI